jgi:hypothetical protein
MKSMLKEFLRKINPDFLHWGTICCQDGLRADFCPFDEAIAVAIGEENGRKDAGTHPAGPVQALCTA